MNEVKYLDNLLKISIALAVLLAGGGVFYHYVIYLPKLDTAIQQKADDEKKSQQLALENAKAKYDSCLNSAEYNYLASWRANCLDKSNKIECSIRLDVANGLRQERQAAKELCLSELKDGM